MKNIYKIILTGLILGTMLVNSSCSLKGLNNDVETTSTPLPTSTDLNNKTETNNPVQEDDTNNLSVLNHTYTTRYGGADIFLDSERGKDKCIPKNRKSEH